MSVVDDLSLFDFSHDNICTETRYLVASVNSCDSTKIKTDNKEVNLLFINYSWPNRYNLLG